MKRLQVLALASYPTEAASSRYRIVQFIEPLAARGIDVTFSPFLGQSLFAAIYEPGSMMWKLPQIAFRTLLRFGDVARAMFADVVFVQREAMLFGPPVIEWLMARLLRRPMVLDLDDATWIAYVSPVYGRLAPLLKRPAKANRLIGFARVVTCGSPNIAAHVRSQGGTSVALPTVVDTRRFRPGNERSHRITTVGWIGSHSTYPYFERLLPIFERLAREQTFRLTIVGSGRAGIRIPGVEVECRPWTMEREVEDFQPLDIGVYPISDDDWSAAKAGFKAVQYMACGVPFVMSPVGVCATMGVAGQTHLQAATDDDWYVALKRLLEDVDLRNRMSVAGRVFAEQHYDVAAQAGALAEILRGVGAVADENAAPFAGPRK